MIDKPDSVCLTTAHPIFLTSKAVQGYTQLVIPEGIGLLHRVERFVYNIATNQNNQGHEDNSLEEKKLATLDLLI